MMHQDSTGKELCVGDRVRWRGRHYTIKAFGPMGVTGTYTLEFEEPLHLDETPEEFAVDLIEDP